MTARLLAELSHLQGTHIYTQLEQNAREQTGTYFVTPPKTYEQSLATSEDTKFVNSFNSYPESFYGLAGAMIRKLIPDYTEADPMALLSVFLTLYGNVIGNNAYMQVEADKHHGNLFTLLVGDTTARKGSAQGQVQNIFKRCSETPLKVEKKNVIQVGRLRNRVTTIKGWISKWASGLSSGEGLIYRVRDASEQTNKDGEPFDPGVEDKRLLVTEPEFASVLTVLQRQGNIVVDILRNAWDGLPLEILTKNTPIKSTGAHVSVIGHITPQELHKYLGILEVRNGFANRWLFIYVARQRYLPNGGDVDAVDFTSELQELRSAIAFGRNAKRLRFDPNAQQFWNEVYSDLSRGLPGFVGAMTARAEAQVLRLSLLYALLDCSTCVALEHLKAALSFWKYSEQSALRIYGTGNDDTDKLLAKIRETGRMTRTEVNAFFNHNKSKKEINSIRDWLQEFRLIEVIEETSSKGHKKEKWVTK